MLAVEQVGITAATPPTNAAYQYMTWDDGERLYDKDGYARPNRAAQHLGVTKVDLNRLGKYPDFDVINEQCSRVIGARNPGLTCGFDR